MTTTYRVITTITWQFDSSEDEKKSLDFAKQQLDKILDTKPHGQEFTEFSVQVDLAKMKERKRFVHLGRFELDEVLPYVTTNDTKRLYQVDDKSYYIRMNSERYQVFKTNHHCAACGLEGRIMSLDINIGDTTPHFNMYAEEHGRLVLMTKDHKLAKSKGGSDDLSNFVTMCSVCNNLKGAYNLTHEQVKELRVLHNNEAKLPRKELRDLINATREEMDQMNQKNGIEAHCIS